MSESQRARFTLHGDLAAPVNSYKVILGAERASNACRFATLGEAQRYLYELTGRWLGAPLPHAVEESPDTVNYVADEFGRATPKVAS